MYSSTFSLLAFVVCFSSAPALSQSFYRYLDLTPTMELVPRAEINSSLAANMICFRLVESGDSLSVMRLDRGETIPVYSFPSGFSVVSTDSVLLWTGYEDESSGYRIEINEESLPISLARLEGAAFLEWEWENDSTVYSYSLDSLGNRLTVDILPNYSATAIRLDGQGDLEYFKYGTVSASAWKYTIDDSGRVVSKTAVDQAGQRIASSDGVLETVYTYDSSGNLTSTRLLNSEGELLLKDYSSALSGNFVFDENGVVVNQEKVAFTEQLFDENSLYITERHYGADGDFVENSFGVASISYKRDILGGISESVWLDIDGNRTEIEGISVTKRLFNSEGRVIESSTYDSNLDIAPFPGGFAYTRFSYNTEGQTVFISYYNAEGLPVINRSLGCHARSFIYDDLGNCIELSYLDTNYNPVNLSTGYAKVVSVFDEEGNLLEHLFYNSEGVLVE